MKWFLVAIALSLVVFYFLQLSDDRKTARTGEPPASAGRRVATFFFILVIATVLSYLVSNMWDAPPLAVGGGVEAATNGPAPIDRNQWGASIKNIRQEVDVGSAPF